jgi:hypothetical protein
MIQGMACIFARDTPLQERLHWILRVSSALCFIGHGAWGIIRKPGWLPFYDIFGISSDIAYATMPLVGTIDIFLGVLILVAPVPAVMLYMVFWAFFTAMLRPSAGMGWWEFLERAGNYGAPLGLLYLCGTQPGIKAWFKPAQAAVLDRSREDALMVLLRVFTALLLIGHGGYGAFQQKAMLVGHWASIGFPPAGFLDGVTWIIYFGWFEIFLGILVLCKPLPWLCLFIVGWKLATEFLYVAHGPVRWEIFEFIERWGSYGVPLALYFLTEARCVPQISRSEALYETLSRRTVL